MTNLRKEAKGRECLIRIPGYCNGDPATTVLAHLPGGGMGSKRSDLAAALACSACHDVVDGRVKTGIPKERLLLWHHEGRDRTNDLWEREGFIKIV